MINQSIFHWGMCLTFFIPIVKPYLTHWLWQRINEMTKITISNQSHKSYRKYKSENGCTRTSAYIRGGIRCHGGVSIPCWPVTPAVSPISTFDKRWICIHDHGTGLTVGVACQQGMLTPARHLIPPPVYPGVRVSPFISLTCNYNLFFFLRLITLVS
jgi:hypothetical protein